MYKLFDDVDLNLVIGAETNCVSYGNILNTMSINAVKNNATIKEFSISGVATNGNQNIVDYISSELCKDQLYYRVSPKPIHVKEKSSVETYLLISDDSCAAVTTRPESVDIEFCTLNGDKYHKAIKYLESAVDRRSRSAGNIYTIKYTNTGLKFRKIGVAGIPLETINYTTDIIDSYNHVLADFPSETPCGKLLLLDGKPGTGKTFLVRALLNDMSDALFVFIHSAHLDKIDDPDLVDAIMEQREYLSGPTIFIAEDADAALVPRQMDNVRTLSTILNTCSGITGDLLNLRIIATTNADISDMDPALLRSGRMCRRMHVDLLQPEHAEKIFKSLTGQVRTFNTSLPLSDIYRAARNDGGWLPSPVKREVGFGLPCAPSG